MMQCVGVDGSGYIVALAETYPACSEFAVVTPAHLERLTYWADLSIALDPTGTDLYLLMASILTLFAIAFGVKQVARLMLNR